MRTIYYLLQKEFLQIFRDKIMLFILFAMPVVQLVVFAYTATYELKETKFHLVDFDQSVSSQRLVNSFEATDYFELGGQSFSVSQGIEDILSNRSKMVLVIPDNFDRALKLGEGTQLQLVVSAVDGSTAGLIQSYSQSIIRSFGSEIRTEIHPVSVSSNRNNSRLSLISKNWYNSQLDYIIYMVPGIITLLVTIICMMLSVLNIVREREIGTIEQINVTPIKKYQFISGKLIPTWILSMIVLTVGLVVSYFWFEIPFSGSILLIYFTAAIYLLAIQGLGLLISSVANTQQEAMFLNFFWFMIFVLMGGIFTPIESMPDWAQQLTVFNPLSYFGRIIRMVLLKGSGWSDIQTMVGTITVMAAILLPAAIFAYQKRTT